MHGTYGTTAAPARRRKAPGEDPLANAGQHPPVAALRVSLANAERAPPEGMKCALLVDGLTVGWINGW
jgi:hypothetical protein